MLVVEKESNQTGKYEQERLERGLKELQENIAAEQNQMVAIKISECLNKWQANQLNIGFCGHFSAGKSTMINQLLGQELLPSSPIPTSANVVTIGFGEPKAIIQFTNGTETTIPITEVERWKEYCIDGEQVEKVSIFVESPLLEGGLQLLDTPGIDSTDDAHQASTEAALHLADVIIFVTDYNHVQSETNFHFIKELKEKGKTLFLVINQIDKHREQELSLATFQQRVKDGLAEWGIKVDGLLFTSLKNPEHPYNQFAQLKELFEQLKGVKEELIHQHLVHALEALLEEHKEFLAGQESEERQELKAQIDELKERSAFTANPHLLQDYRQSEAAFSMWKQETEDEMLKIMDNAIITPYATTQAAQALIESYQKDFKVGWLFTQKKTDEERQRRLEALYADLAARVESQIEWHLKEMLRKKAEDFQINDQEYHSTLLDWSLTIPEEWLVELIRTETVSREFVYNYTKELARKIHQLYRQYVLQLVEQAESLFAHKHQERFVGLQSRISMYEQIETIENELAQLDAKLNQRVESYKRTLKELFKHTSSMLEWKLEELVVTQHEQNANRTNGSAQRQVTERVGGQKLLFNKEPLAKAAEKLEHAAQLIKPISSLHALSVELAEKAERLRQNKFTICLFGAFSAGKSSFANALLGSPVLPVSPNPTTAAINQVLPATVEHPSGSAMIKMKSKSQVEEEIALSLKRLHLSVSGNTTRDLQQIKTVQPHELRGSLKPYYSFLSACQKGFEQAEAKFGSHFKVNEEEFSQYVAVEHKACFVESIQLYHDAYLTSQGMEIIDTPGADSIYSRHTNVTFNYIKHADVILYVTYYNHAFSRADRQFLDQLGRVKDQFALDKMFFLVNAADLAQSEEELQGVVQHVEQNLLQSGIRFPRIFPISSLRAIQGEQDSGMEEFERAFFHFVQEDVSSLLVEGAEQDVHKAFTLLTKMKEELQLSATVREEKIKELEGKVETWRQAIDKETYPSFLIEIEKEIKEHFYYIRQRLFFNFQTHFHEAFHPSVLTGERNAKQQLPMCLDELLHSLLFQLKEEFTATSLRLENFIYRLQERAGREWQRKLEEEGISLTGQLAEKQDLGIPPLTESFGSKHNEELGRSLAQFKNPKHFFEQGGKEKLRENLEKNLQQVVDEYLLQTNHIFQEFYTEAWHVVEVKWKEKLKEGVQLAVVSRLSALKGDLSAADLNSIIEQYQHQVM